MNTPIDKKMKQLFSMTLTNMLIILCFIIALISRLGDDPNFFQALWINYGVGESLFTDVMQGEVWRLLTPIFMHFGFLHILFNMMFLFELGHMLEFKKGSGFYMLFIVVTGIAGNVAQYLITDNPFFGGMSGVVYALFAYIWIQGRINPRFGVALDDMYVFSFLFWAVAGFTGLLGNVAIWAHAGGFAAGAAWAFIDKNRKATLSRG